MPPGWKAYRDFILKIEPAGEGAYRVEAQIPAGGEGEANFVLPFDDKDLEIFLLKTGRPRRIGNRGQIPQPSTSALEFGENLFRAIFKDKVRDIFVAARNEAEQKGYGLRLRLRLVGVPELADLPWEYLYDRPNFLALSTTTPLVRYIDLPSPPRPLAVALPLRVLVTISSPQGLPALDVAGEQAKIQTALAGLIKDQKIELEFNQDATLQSLQRILRQARSQGRPFHAWHFIGHGVFDPAAQTGQLALCDVHGMLATADGFQLGTLLGDYPEIGLVLLNACEGARNSRKDPFAGVATSLVERGIPAVIGMQFEISDEAAIVFSDGFYTSLVDGLPVDAALTEARRSIFFMPNHVEWATPVLFMRSPNGVLFKIQRRPSREAAERQTAQEAQPEQPETEKAGPEGLASSQTRSGPIFLTAEKEQAGPERFTRGQGEGDNPFTYGNPISNPDRFFGRELEAKQVFSRMCNAEAESSSIVGERRVGKTSLLQHLMNPEVRHRYGADSDKLVLIYFDLQMLDEKTTPTRLWQRIIRQLALQSQDPDIKTMADELRKTEEIDNFALADLFDTINYKEYQLAFLFDEFEHVTANPNFTPDFFYGLRSLAIHNHLTLITSSRSELIELTHSNEIRSSPFFNIFANINLRVLTFEEAEELMDRNLSDREVKFSEKERKTILRLAGTHPFFLQAACYFLFEAYRQGLDEPARQKYLFKEFTEEAGAHLANYWKDSSDPEKIVMTALALLNQQSRAGEKTFKLARLQDLYPRSHQTLARLEKRSLLTEAQDGYALFSQVLADWISAEISDTTGDRQGFTDWLNSNQAALERLGEAGRQQVVAILPKIAAKYRGLMIEWVSDPRNLAAVTALLRAALGES